MQDRLKSQHIIYIWLNTIYNLGVKSVKNKALFK